MENSFMLEKKYKYCEKDLENNYMLTSCGSALSPKSETFSLSFESRRWFSGYMYITRTLLVEKKSVIYQSLHLKWSDYS